VITSLVMVQVISGVVWNKYNSGVNLQESYKYNRSDEDSK